MPPNQPPKARLTGQTPVQFPNPIRVDGSKSRDPGDGTIARWEVYWPDGHITSGTGHPGVVERLTPAGTYDITLVVYDNQQLTGTDTCTIVVLADETAPEPPQDCVLSDWLLTAVGPWSPCVDGQQTRDEIWARTILVPPAHGGAACGPLQETRTVTQPCEVPVPSPPGTWPSFAATYVLEPIKKDGAPNNVENTDPWWIHMHLPDDSVTLRLLAWSEHVNIPNRLDIPLTSLPPGYSLRYVLRGIPVTDWLLIPDALDVTLTYAQIAATGLTTGIHDLSLEVEPADTLFQPNPTLLHLHVHHSTPNPTVPSLARDDDGTEAVGGRNRSSAVNMARMGPGAIYLNVKDRKFVGYPISPVSGAWTPNVPPYEQVGLYNDEMGPHSNLFMPHPMWWQEPDGSPSEKMKFVRCLPPKFGGEDARGLYDNTGNGASPGTAFGYGGHRTFPFKDGPRGVGWCSAYVTGQIDSHGGFAFVEAGGPLRYMAADGTLITVAGWRVHPDKDPVWILKPWTTITQNMVLEGKWLSGQYANQSGFRLPLDVAIDPKNENIWYVVGFHDHCVWKVVITDRILWDATVSVFAGDPGHTWGHADGFGTAARFKGPSSLVFDPLSDALYVADQDNDSIRKITRAGEVTTILGAPGMAARLAAAGATDMRAEYMYDDQHHSYDRMQNRQLSQFVTPPGGQPDLYMPYALRVDSKGHLILMEAGYGAIRRLHMQDGVPTGQADLLTSFVNWAGGQGIICTKFAPNNRSWMWMDCDRWGKTGPKDGIFWCNVTGSFVDGELGEIRFNEQIAWCPGEGGPMRWVFGHDDARHPDGWGPREHTDGPHYPWMVTVDPNGGLWTSGAGEHGLCRLRPGRPDDPIPTNEDLYYYGKYLWWRLQDWATLQDFSAGTPAPALKYGWGAHNYLGMPDMWGFRDATDQEIIDQFIPASVQASPTHLAYLLNFLRWNAGVGP